MPDLRHCKFSRKHIDITEHYFPVKIECSNGKVMSKIFII